MRNAYNEALRRVRTGQSSDDGALAPAPQRMTYDELGYPDRPGDELGYPSRPSEPYAPVQGTYPDDGETFGRYPMPYQPTAPVQGTYPSDPGLGYIGPDGRWYPGNPCYGPPRYKCHWPVPGEGNDTCCYLPECTERYNPCINWNACRRWRGSSMSPLIGYVTG